MTTLADCKSCIMDRTNETAQNFSMETQPASSSSENVDDVLSTQAEPSRDDTLFKVLNCIETFEEQLLDAELNLRRSEDIAFRIDVLLNRQLEHNQLTVKEFIDLSHVRVLWTEVINALNTYNLGSIKNKRLIITNLLQLFSRKQLNEEAFIDFVTQL